MNHDRLEQFIIENREAFNTELPNLKNWYLIEKQLKQQARKTRYLQARKYVLMAAAVVGLLFMGGLIGFFLTKPVEEIATVDAIKNIAPELQETEMYYQNQIADKTTMLVALQKDTSVLQDMREIDVFLSELKTELEHTPKENRETVISNIIKSYQVKLEILERVLNIMSSDSIHIQNSAENEISI